MLLNGSGYESFPAVTVSRAVIKTSYESYNV